MYIISSWTLWALRCGDWVFWRMWMFVCWAGNSFLWTQTAHSVSPAGARFSVDVLSLSWALSHLCSVQGIRQGGEASTQNWGHPPSSPLLPRITPHSPVPVVSPNSVLWSFRKERTGGFTGVLSSPQGLACCQTKRHGNGELVPGHSHLSRVNAELCAFSHSRVLLLCFCPEVYLSSVVCSEWGGQEQAGVPGHLAVTDTNKLKDTRTWVTGDTGQCLLRLWVLGGERGTRSRFPPPQPAQMEARIPGENSICGSRWDLLKPILVDYTDQDSRAPLPGKGCPISSPQASLSTFITGCEGVKKPWKMTLRWENTRGQKKVSFYLH